MTISTDEIKTILRKNSLFKWFSERQLDFVVSLVKEVKFQKGEIIIRENEINDQLFIILKGEVEISKLEKATGQSYRIATMSDQAVIGEVTLLDDSPRSATVHALTDTTLLSLSLNELRAISNQQSFYSKAKSKFRELFANEQPIYYLMVRNLAKSLGHRIRDTNEAVVDALRKELEYSKERVAMGRLIINVFSALVIYVFAVKLLNESHFHAATSSIISFPLLIIFATIVITVMVKSGYSYDRYGLTLKDWPVALKEGLLLAATLITLSLVVKWGLIHSLPAYSDRVMFDGEFFKHEISYDELIFVFIIYQLFVPLQELMARGLLQSSFEDFFVGSHRKLNAIVLSNLLFSLTHLHLPFTVGVLVFITGSLWGWLYSRHRTLVGVVISHQIIGGWELFVLGA